MLKNKPQHPQLANSMSVNFRYIQPFCILRTHQNSKTYQDRYIERSSPSIYGECDASVLYNGNSNIEIRVVQQWLSPFPDGCEDSLLFKMYALIKIANNNHVKYRMIHSMISKLFLDVSTE